MSRMETFKQNVLFSFFSLAVLAFSICVLSGCRTPSESQYRLFSVNGSNITNSMDRYMFGLSGTCGSSNGTIRCHSAFPNTFNITAATIAEVTSSNSSNLSATYATQSEQNTSTNFMNHTRVHHLSEAVSFILIVSVVFGFLFLPLSFLLNASKPRSRGTQILFGFVILDWFAQCAAVVIVFLIIRNEKASARASFLGINSTYSPVKFELGFWLLMGAVASRLLSGVPVVVSNQAQTKSEKKLRDTDNVSDEFYGNLTFKIASTIGRLREAIGTFRDQQTLDEGCKRLFARFRDDEKLASIFPSHWYRQSAALFLGMDSGEPPGPLLYSKCPYHGHTEAPKPGGRGVYLVIVRECCHGAVSPVNSPEYKYVGSSSNVMLRVKQHTDPTYRNSEPSQLYKAWDSLINTPCVAIYQLAEWDRIPNSVGAAGSDEILLAEAIWQVVLQTSVRANMSEFTEHLQKRGRGDADLFSNAWRGCNVYSALETGSRNRRAY